MIRDLENDDVETLKAIHRESGFDYGFPDLGDPLFLVKVVVEEDGKTVQGLALKLTASAYLWIDETWGSPLMRWHRLKNLVLEAKKQAWAKGLDELYAVIPPEIAKVFEPWLKMLGLSKDRDWPKYSVDLTEGVG